MARFTDAEGMAIVNNTMMRMAEYSLMAQTIQGHSTRNPAYYSGIASDLDIQIDQMLSKYGPAITGEALENVTADFTDIDNPALYYRTSDEEINDEQDDYFNRLSDELERLADALKAEEERIQKEKEAEEERKRQEQENRERAREQAERARETEEKYKQKETPKEPTGIFGKIGAFFKGLFRRGK